MICRELPQNKREIEVQLKKNGIVGLRDTAMFLTGVGKQGRWNEQEVSKEYMLQIRSFIIEILDELKEQNV